MKALRITGFVALGCFFLTMLWLAGADERARMKETPLDLSVKSRGSQISFGYGYPRRLETDRRLEVPAGYSIAESWYCNHHQVVFGTIDDPAQRPFYGEGTAGIEAVCWIEVEGLWACYPLNRGFPILDGVAENDYRILRVVRTEENGELNCIVQWGQPTWEARVIFKRRG